jgi:hypothetical protein
MNYIHMHNELLPLNYFIKKEETLTFASNLAIIAHRSSIMNEVGFFLLYRGLRLRVLDLLAAAAVHVNIELSLKSYPS